jgi:hypothetical protein
MKLEIGRLAALAAAALATGCAGWQAQGFEPAVVVEREHPDRLRLTRTDSSRTEVRGPSVANDSLIGTAASGRLAVPLDSVAYVELRRRNSLPIILGASLGTAAAVIVLLAATWND